MTTDLVAQFGCEISDNAELSGLASTIRGSVPWFDSDFAFSFVAHCCSVLSLSPIKDGLQQYMERDVMGDMYRCRDDTSKLRNFNSLKVF